MDIAYPHMKSAHCWRTCEVKRMLSSLTIYWLTRAKFDPNTPLFAVLNVGFGHRILVKLQHLRPAWISNKRYQCCQSLFFPWSHIAAFHFIFSTDFDDVRLSEIVRFDYIYSPYSITCLYVLQFMKRYAVSNFRQTPATSVLSLTKRDQCFTVVRRYGNDDRLRWMKWFQF